jgi:SulP family sulfate permease
LFGGLSAAWRIARSRGVLERDLSAALSVALFTIPQGMAYALIAHLPPATGIWTSAIASIVGAAFGSSEFLINGPTNAMSVLLAANAALFLVHGDPIQMIVLLTAMIGIGQLLAAALKLGRFTRFVSEPVLIGFTAGAGIYVAINQLPGVLGLERGAIVADLAGWKPWGSCVFDLARTILSLGSTNLVALAVGASTFFLVRALQYLERRIGRRIPAPFVAVVLAAVICYALGLGEASMGESKLKLVRDIEPLSRAIPKILWPDFKSESVIAMLSPAFAIGMLGAVEAIAIGKVLASRAGHKFDANSQLFGEGACNIGAALIGGFASSGSFTRSAVNFESGAATRLSGIFSGVMVVIAVLLFAPAANYIPVCALSGTLVHIGLKLVNVSKLKATMQTTRSDLSVLLATFVGVLFTEHLQYALFIGIGVSLVQALRRAEGFKMVGLVEDGKGHLLEQPFSTSPLSEVVAIDLQGELFFAAADVLEERLLSILEDGPRYMVLRLAQSYNLDFTCAEALQHVARAASAKNGRLILSGVRTGTYGTLQRAGTLDAVGADAVFKLEAEVMGSTIHAIRYAHQLADAAKKTEQIGEAG